MWFIPAALVGLLLWAFASGKSKGKHVYPKAGETWSLIICTTRPLTTSDYQAWFKAVAPMSAIRGVQRDTRFPGKNCYIVTMTFNETPGPLRIGQVTELVGGKAVLVAAVRAPIR